MEPTSTSRPTSQTVPTKYRPLSLLPSPFPDEDINSPESYDGALLHDVVYSDHRHPPTSSPSSLSLPQHPANFSAFFTLIEDSSTGEHHHPSVHYIFSDDDPDVITDALLHTLSPDSAAGWGTGNPEEEGHKERYLLVDVSANGDEILSATSLAADWQILDAQLLVAPNFDGESGPDRGEAGLLLKVEGAEVKQESHDGTIKDMLNKAKSKSGGDAWGALKSLEEKFLRDMEALKKMNEGTGRPIEQEHD